MAGCTSAIQYGTTRYTCTQPAGHKGPHFDAEGPMSWTCSITVIPPWHA